MLFTESLKPAPAKENNNNNATLQDFLDELLEKINHPNKGLRPMTNQRLRQQRQSFPRSSPSKHQKLMDDLKATFMERNMIG